MLTSMQFRMLDGDMLRESTPAPERFTSRPLPLLYISSVSLFLVVFESMHPIFRYCIVHCSNLLLNPLVSVPFAGKYGEQNLEASKGDYV